MIDIELSFVLPFLAVLFTFSLSLKLIIHSLKIAEKIKFLPPGFWRFLAKVTIGLVLFGMLGIIFLVVWNINNPKKAGEGSFTEFVEAMCGFLLKVIVVIVTFSVVAIASFSFYFFKKIKHHIPRYNLSTKHKICLSVIGTALVIELVIFWIVVRNYCNF